MSLAWHIIRKDLVRLRWILVLWVVLLIASLGVAAIQANLNYETYFPYWIMGVVVSSGFLPLLAFGLVMGLLHDDPVAELDAFWITRPISGSQLLVAKLLALLLLAAIPVLVAIPFWLSYDYSGSQIARATLQILQGHFLIVVLALPFAAISVNGSKFVMNVMLGAGGLLLLFLLLNIGGSDATAAPVLGLARSKAWLMMGLWLGVTLFVMVNQFLRRRTRQSLLVLTVAVAVGFTVIVKIWPWSFAVPSGESSHLAPDGAPIFPAVVDGKAIATSILAEAPLREKTSVARAGMVLKIQNIFVDYTGELQIAFTEGTPQLAQSFGDRLPGTEQKDAPEYYFLINRNDGRVLPVTPSREGNKLEAATLRFFHYNLRLRPAAGAWQGGAPPNLGAWLQDARLIRVVAADAPLHP